MKLFTSSGHAQRFLSAFSGISPHFRPIRAQTLCARMAYRDGRLLHGPAGSQHDRDCILNREQPNEGYIASCAKATALLFLSTNVTVSAEAHNSHLLSRAINETSHRCRHKTMPTWLSRRTVQHSGSRRSRNPALKFSILRRFSELGAVAEHLAAIYTGAWGLDGRNSTP